MGGSAQGRIGQLAMMEGTASSLLAEMARSRSYSFQCILKTYTMIDLKDLTYAFVRKLHLGEI